VVDKRRISGCPLTTDGCWSEAYRQIAGDRHRAYQGRGNWPAAVTLGDSEVLEVGTGSWPLEIPRSVPHRNEGHRVREGTVIGVGPYDDLIQTDAAINPQQRRPLFNMMGEVVGINTIIIATGRTWASPCR